MERVERITSSGLEVMKIKEFIAAVFPVMSVSPDKKPDPQREAIRYLVSIGELGRTSLDGIVDKNKSPSPDDKLVMRVGSTMLGAYGEVLMRKYNISPTDLLPPEKVVQLAKDLIEGKFKFQY